MNNNKGDKMNNNIDALVAEVDEMIANGVPDREVYNAIAEMLADRYED
jgi:hypothetical protein